MCFTNSKIDQACGFLLLNESNTFIYCCKSCESEFESILDLETHILTHYNENKSDIEHVFVQEFKHSKWESTDNIAELKNEKCAGESTDEEIHQVPQMSCDEDEITSESSDCENDEDYNPAARKKTKKKTYEGDWFHCEVCPKLRFKSSEKLEIHKKRHKVNRVSKKCAICRKATSNYEYHMKKAHSIDMPYKCDYCNETFDTGSQRRIHVRTHTGHRPFQCMSCNEFFISEPERQMHKSQCQFSLPMIPESYTCEECGKQFTTMDYFRKHKLTHGEKMLPCRYCDKHFKGHSNRRKHEKNLHERK